MKRYQVVLLGHSEQTIQDRLDGLRGGEIIGLVTIGVNVLAIVDNHDRAWPGPVTSAFVNPKSKRPKE